MANDTPKKECLIMALKLVWGLPVIIIPFPKFWQCLQISQNLANPTTLNRIPSDCQMCLRTSQEWIQRKRPFLDLLFISAIEERLQRSDAIENLGNGKKQPRCQVSALFGTSEVFGIFFHFNPTVDLSQIKQDVSCYSIFKPCISDLKHRNYNIKHKHIMLNILNISC